MKQQLHDAIVDTELQMQRVHKNKIKNSKWEKRWGQHDQTSVIFDQELNQNGFSLETILYTVATCFATLNMHIDLKENNNVETLRKN